MEWKVEKKKKRKGKKERRQERRKKEGKKYIKNVGGYEQVCNKKRTETGRK